METIEEKKENTCAKCGTVITEENKSFSTMVCNKPECIRFAELMDW